MKFGLSLPTLTGFPRATEPADGGWRLRWQRSFETAALAERLGFDYGTVGHHRFTLDRVDSSQPLISLAALAARTTRLKLCTNIAVLPLHDPIDIAEQAAMVDEISDGRLILGFGLGYRSYEFDQIGLKYKDRVSRFEEALTIIRQAWSKEAVTFEGRHFNIKGANVTPKPVQKPGPPIWLGAQVDAAIDRAARLGDGWLTDNIESAALLGVKVKRFRQMSRAAGNAGTVVLNRKIGIGRDRKTVEEEWLPPILDVYRNYLELGVPFDADFAAKLGSGKPLQIRDLPPGQIIAGTPEDVAAGLRLCIEHTAPDSVIVDFGRGAHGESYRRAYEQIEMFGRDVMPMFA